MSKYKVELLQPAWDDLAEIAEYYMMAYGVESAKRVTDRILDDLELLREFPLAYNYVPDEDLREEGYRKLISGKYVAIYRLINNVVYVYHIAHIATEYPKLFKDLNE